MNIQTRLALAANSLRVSRRTRIILAAVVAVGALWMSGRMDTALSGVGLNKNACVTNAFGAKFCGDDARTLCAQFGGQACATLGYETPTANKADDNGFTSDDEGFTVDGCTYRYDDPDVGVGADGTPC